ncbi:aspartate:alanine exchanger family transporter [Gloeocapsa sp. PCC 73106]|uniref:aspartate:alanine exchanger family transporter n=1 Tax=Gloeocapsa sp. PCC 73106 TaxID=102232 RepID=UPI0002ACCE32|nr:TrkA C-terminal domain-containing protein [Gloeocapsa sp. PCC 73106]ELR97062.1 putative permease [Gloeocapsa sp. PCC 73106]
MLGLQLLLENQPILTLFLVIGLGSAIGEISLFGFRLGVGAVLFVGLFIGAIAPKAVPPGMLGTVGLIIFFYGIGIQYGKPFVEGLLSKQGRQQNLIAFLSILGTGLITILLITGFKIPVEIALGLFSGALVNTAALQTVLSKVNSDLPVVGYGVAYPFGVFGPILCLYLALRIINPQTTTPPRTTIKGTELVVSNPLINGKSLGEIINLLPQNIQILAIRQNGHDRLPKATLKINLGDEILVEAEGEALKTALNLIGQESEPDIMVNRRDLDDLIVYASNSGVIGRKLGELNLTENHDCVVVSVFRGDSELYSHPSLTLEAGDRVRVIAPPEQFQGVRQFFGDSARSTAEVSYLALGLGMVLGVLFGLIRFPLGGLGSVSFGAAGGAMVVSLLLGWLGHTGQITWTIPASANLTLRNFGLTLFLAVAGLGAAQQFFSTVQETGFSLLGGGIAITLGAVLISLVLSYFVFRFPFDEMVGVVAGVTGNPAILAYASKIVPTNKPELGYAFVFPTTTILKIVIVQLILERVK